MIETGFVSVKKTGTQETLIANSGSTIELKGVNLAYGAGQTIDNAPVVATESKATLNPVSTTNPIITISGILDRTVSSEMDLIIIFDTLRRSKGIKLLYYSSTDDDVSAGGEDGWSNVISELGVDNVEGNTNQDGDTVSDKHTQSDGELYNEGDPMPHLHVYVRSISIPQTSDDRFLTYTLTCEVT